MEGRRGIHDQVREVLGEMGEEKKLTQKIAGFFERREDVLWRSAFYLPALLFAVWLALR